MVSGSFFSKMGDIILSSYIYITAFFKEDEENTVEKDEHEIISQPRRNKNQPIWKENDAFVVSELDLQHIILLCVPTEDIPRHLSTMHERWITQVQLTQLPVGKTTQWLSVILQKMLLDPTKGGTTSLTQPAVTMKSNIFQGNGKLTVLANC